jgi:hypothetical protein
MSIKSDLRPDGWWIIFPEGEEAGPFACMEDAEAFLDYVENLQRQIKAAQKKQTPEANGNPAAE